MAIQAAPAADAAQLALVQQKLLLDNRLRGGIGWFYWIAGLSLLNSGAYLFGAKFSFVIGLGITQMVDGIVSALIKELGESWSLLRVASTGVDILIAGTFLLIGYLGRKRMRWPVIAGMMLYALDGIVVLLFKDYLGALFHGWALAGIWAGLRAMQHLNALDAAGDSESIESLRQRSAAVLRPQVTPQQLRLRWILIALIVLIVLVPFVISALQR